MERIEDMLGSGHGPLRSRGCLAVLDIDNFKSINDRYGHPAGDSVLKSVAKTMNSVLRRSDILGRVGGEEFVVVLPSTGSSEAELIVERMLALTRTARHLKEVPDLRVTFSAGIAEVAHNDISLSLYARADRALFRAKSGGRNRIEIAEQNPNGASAKATPQ